MAEDFAARERVLPYKYASERRKVISTSVATGAESKKSTMIPMQASGHVRELGASYSSEMVSRVKMDVAAGGVAEEQGAATIDEH